MKANFQSSLAKIASVLAVSLVCFVSDASACVGCREPGAFTLEHENPTVLAGIGFSFSVIFMLAFVLSVVGGMSFYIWQTCKRLAQNHVGGAGAGRQEGQ